MSKLSEVPPTVMVADREALPAPDLMALRQALGTYLTGVTTLTFRRADGTPRGFAANSFAPAPLEPPLLLARLAESVHSCGEFMEAKGFAVNVLGEEQKAVSGLFASRTTDRFEQCAWREGAAGLRWSTGRWPSSPAHGSGRSMPATTSC